MSPLSEPSPFRCLVWKCLWNEWMREGSHHVVLLCTLLPEVLGRGRGCGGPRPSIFFPRQCPTPLGLWLPALLPGAWDVNKWKCAH